MPNFKKATVCKNIHRDISLMHVIHIYTNHQDGYFAVIKGW